MDQQLRIAVTVATEFDSELMRTAAVAEVANRVKDTLVKSARSMGSIGKKLLKIAFLWAKKQMLRIRLRLKRTGTMLWLSLASITLVAMAFLFAVVGLVGTVDAAKAKNPELYSFMQKFPGDLLRLFMGATELVDGLSFEDFGRLQQAFVKAVAALTVVLSAAFTIFSTVGMYKFVKALHINLKKLVSHLRSRSTPEAGILDSIVSSLESDITKLRSSIKDDESYDTLL